MYSTASIGEYATNAPSTRSSVAMMRRRAPARKSESSGVAVEGVVERGRDLFVEARGRERRAQIRADRDRDLDAFLLDRNRDVFGDERRGGVVAFVVLLRKI